VRLRTVAALNGISTVTVWRWSNSGILPAPVKRGGVTAWRVGDLRKSLAQWADARHDLPENIVRSRANAE
jgi:predicted DNA-binding transcriptional regulator AlpA